MASDGNIDTAIPRMVSPRPSKDDIFSDEPRTSPIFILMRDLLCLWSLRHCRILRLLLSLVVKCLKVHWIQNDRMKSRARHSIRNRLAQVREENIWACNTKHKLHFSFRDMTNLKNTPLLYLHQKHRLVLHLCGDGRCQHDLIQGFIDALALAVQLDVHFRRLALQVYSGRVWYFNRKVFDIDLFDAENRLLLLIAHVGFQRMIKL